MMVLNWSGSTPCCSDPSATDLALLELLTPGTPFEVADIAIMKRSLTDAEIIEVSIPAAIIVKVVVRRRRMPHELPTRKAAIRNHRLEYTGYHAEEVGTCNGSDCPFYPHRLGYAANSVAAGIAYQESKQKSKTKRVHCTSQRRNEVLPPLAAIRQRWLWTHRLGYSQNQKYRASKNKPRKEEGLHVPGRRFRKHNGDSRS